MRSQGCFEQKRVDVTWPPGAVLRRAWGGGRTGAGASRGLPGDQAADAVGQGGGSPERSGSGGRATFIGPSEVGGKRRKGSSMSPDQ